MLKGLRKKASLLSLSLQALYSLFDLNHEQSTFQYQKILKQVHDFEVALKAMDYLVDDRTPEGIELLQTELKKHELSGNEQPVAIFHLALGVMGFIEATLGFEPEIMSNAHKALTEAESSSLNNSKYNAKHQLVTSHIYPPGTEFQVTYAESTLLNALVMLLQEDNGMVESAKALYKLRKAYHTLDLVYKKIIELEPVFNKNLAKLKRQSKSSSMSSVDLPGFNQEKASSDSLPYDLKLMKNLEDVFEMRKARIEGTSIGGDPFKVNLFAESVGSLGLSRKKSDIINHAISHKDSMNLTVPQMPKRVSESIDGEDLSDDEFSDAYDILDESVYEPPSITGNSNVSILTASSEDTNTNYLHVSTIDEFIHSGVQLCFGILQVVLSLIPPAIGRVLSIVGFKGDREVGLKLLWKNAITCRNIHGDLALLCLLIFYDGPVQFVDSGFRLPDNNTVDTTLTLDITSRTTISDNELDQILMSHDLYTPQLVSKVRRFFPHNALWILQEGRVIASQGQLSSAIKLMQDFTDDPNTKIQMQQSEALLIFDKACLYAFNQQFDEAANDFIRLIDLNSWCKSIYLYMAGSCYVAKWRMIKLGLITFDNEQDKNNALEDYALKAEKYITLAPTYIPGIGSNATNRKGGIGGGNKQQPFDKFVKRKTEQLQARKAQYPKASFMDLIISSPIHELIYFWNGYNRMNQEQLEISMKVLSYSGKPNTEYSANIANKVPESEDEAMIRYFFQSIILRLMGKVTEGLNLLDTKVLSEIIISQNPFKFNKVTYSPYLGPTALYEKTMFVWLLKTSKEFDVKQVVEETKAWLKKASIVSDVGDYELSNRTNMRIKAASEKVEQIGQSLK